MGTSGPDAVSIESIVNYPASDIDRSGIGGKVQGLRMREDHKQWHFSAVLGAMMTLVVLASLAGCSPFPANPLASALHGQLDDSNEPRVIDFSPIVEGEWTQMVLVCQGDSAGAINDALGYDWSDLPAGFESGFIFSTGHEVTTFYESGDTSASREPWIYPCPLPRILDESDLTSPLVIERAEAKVKFVESQGSMLLWYVDDAEFRRLAG